RNHLKNKNNSKEEKGLTQNENLSNSQHIAKKTFNPSNLCPEHVRPVYPSTRLPEKKKERMQTRTMASSRFCGRFNRAKPTDVQPNFKELLRSVYGPKKAPRIRRKDPTINFVVKSNCGGILLISFYGANRWLWKIVLELNDGVI
ncbi:hypothetical protein JTE90_012573, partial [Oedothorax gibbosus]